jgi:diaminopimelate decarboxylase
MHDFRYVGNKLFCEAIAVDSLAKKFGTPLYVYSQNTLRDHYSKLVDAIRELNPQICFSVKSNSNLSVLRLLGNLGSGFDVVSAGELKRVIAAGGDPAKCIFAGVGKTEDEIALALQQNVYSFNAESEPELERIDQVAARLKKRAPVAVRVNPDVQAGGHKKITTGTYENKFGIAFEKVEGVYARAERLKNLHIRGIQMHIGSQITSIEPFEKAVSRVLPLVELLKKRYAIEFFSLGGGLGIIYQSALASGSSTVEISRSRLPYGSLPYAEKLLPLLRPLGLRILIEPGRFITGNAGILVTRVEYVKRTERRTF